MHLTELKALHVSALLEMAAGLEIENTQRMRKQELMFAILKKRAKGGETIFGDGVLEVLPDGFGFLRSPEASYMASTDDIYISPAQIRRFNLHTGDAIEGEVRTPKEGERYFALVKVDKINGLAPEALKNRIMFENLTPLHPDRPMHLERDIKAEENLTGRIIDMISPIGFGQRALLVASPKSGKTVMMQHIAHAISANHPDAVLIVLLVDERPEEVTEMQRSVKGEVVASTFDEPAVRHVQVAEMVIEKAKRIVESVSKETFFAEIEKLRQEFSLIKQENEALKAENESLKVEMSTIEEGAQPLAHNPEANAPKQMFKIGKNRTSSIEDAVFNRIFSK